MTTPLETDSAPTDTEPPVGASSVSLRLSTELRRLVDECADRPVRLETIFEATKGRGYHLLLLFIALPFVTPLPLPGLSIPFGVALVILGGRMVLGQKPWLPQRLLRRELPPRVLKLLVPIMSRTFSVLEALVRSRPPSLRRHPILGRIAGVLIVSSGLFLTLPLPIPLSNSLPAWTVIFLAAGALGDDGLFLLLGGLSFLISVAFFAFLAVGGTLAIEHFYQVVIPG